jgi:predicted HicB family RNase H-like nuclease
MNANQIAQIATSLNVSPNQIKRAEEWATVLFVVVQGKGARFVSKKVIKESVMKEYLYMNDLVNFTDEEYQAHFERAVAKFQSWQLRGFANNEGHTAEFFNSRIQPVLEARLALEAAQAKPKAVAQTTAKDYFFGAADEESF